MQICAAAPFLCAKSEERGIQSGKLRTEKKR